MTRKRLICLDCGKYKKHKAKGLCDTCYQRNRRKDNKHVQESSRKSSMDWLKKHPYKGWSGNTIRHHKRKGYNIKFTVSELTYKTKNTPNCELCGVKLDYSFGTKNGFIQANSPALDRKNNEKLMTMDNIQILCRVCNSRKSWLTQGEYQKILDDRLMIEKI